MSKVIYVCARDRLAVSVAERLEEICRNLAPDNIAPNPPKIVVDEKTAYGVMNPAGSMLERGNSVLIGKLFEEEANWWESTHGLLDGSFALFRDAEHCFEIVSDPVGSRAIWYYLDRELFIASTSQRAITMYIGSFEFDERIIPWMLSTGSLGPQLSWDKRIERVPPDSAVILKKKEWSISTKSNPVDFALLEESKSQHEELLREAIEDTFESLNLDLSSWVLPLSGGYDSRGILCLLHNTSNGSEGLRTITWGLEASLHQKRNDAYVARELANRLRVSHKYYLTEEPEEPVEEIVNRFVLLGEGRIDHLSGYMDGFRIWKTLFEEGVEGVIRGDEGFGWVGVSSSLSVRHSVGCPLCSDFRDLKKFEEFGFKTQELPGILLRREGETLAAWRDKLYHGFRLPTILSSLSDLKLPYVELMNPLLSRKILQQVRRLPDDLRTEKTLYKKVVTDLSPRVDFATDEAIARRKNVFKQEEVVNLLEGELSSEQTKSIFPAGFLHYISSSVKIDRQAKAVRSGLLALEASVERLVPRFLVNVVLDSGYLPSVSHNVLAFRVFLISRMNTILREDSVRVSQ